MNCGQLVTAPGRYRQRQGRPAPAQTSRQPGRAPSRRRGQPVAGVLSKPWQCAWISRKRKKDPPDGGSSSCKQTFGCGLQRSTPKLRQRLISDRGPAASSCPDRGTYRRPADAGFSLTQQGADATPAGTKPALRQSHARYDSSPHDKRAAVLAAGTAGCADNTRFTLPAWRLRRSAPGRPGGAPGQPLPAASCRR